MLFSRKSMHPARKKTAAGDVRGGFHCGDRGGQAAVFFAGSFSLIRADLPLRSRK
jgi:hypothetical protein